MTQGFGIRAGWLAAAVLMVVPANRAHAWGDEGHRIVALVAQHYLTARTQARVRALLAQDGTGLTEDRSMASEATWADHYRDSDRDGTRVRYEQTWRWHFVDGAPQVAYALEQHIGPRQIAAWQRGGPPDWALESFGLAQRVAYGELPAPSARGRYRLTALYMRASREVVALQLSRAGVRLAWLLNRALDTSRANSSQ